MQEQVNICGGTSPIQLARVVIDAGHGGRDPGAVGRVLGLFEKDVVLDIALGIEQMAKESGAFEAILPRRTDVRLTIAERNAPAGDIFLSLHCNAFTDPLVHGSEVFYLRGMQESSYLADWVLDSILRETGWRNRGVKPNNTFGVLRGNRNRPAVLVEYDFISNAQREREFMDKLTRRNLARATYQGIVNFLAVRSTY